ncbi:dystonin isoform X2 [Heterodontus francisci]|uniref:dystonin isoform X2 n=1 Tax=Heterodontus francisci TaxID=7792 RepID=UPI00355C9789
MGNTCGCVRAQKEECAVDPAKAPLGRSPYPRSKLFLKRKKKKKDEELPFPQEFVKLSDSEGCREIAASAPLPGRALVEDFSGESLPRLLGNGNGRSDGTGGGSRTGSKDERSYLTSSPTGRLSDVGESSSLSISGSCVLYQSEGDVESDGASRECVAGSNELSRAKKQKKKRKRLKRSEVQDDLFNRHCLDFETKRAVSMSNIAWSVPYPKVESQSDSRPSRSLGDILDCALYNTASGGRLFADRVGLSHHKLPLTVFRPHTKRQQGAADCSDSSPTALGNRLLPLSGKVSGESAMSRHKRSAGNRFTSLLNEISDIHVTGESEDMSAKEKLLLWSQQTTEGYAGVRCENFTSCWRDGRLFNAIIHKYRPDLVDMSQVSVQSNVSNLEQAFGVAEKLGVTRLLDPEDVNVPSPDEKSVITYVSSLYDVFPKVPEDGEGINANDIDVKWIEYQNMVNYLIQWIKHHVTVMSDRSYSNNPAELKALYNQYMQFKDTEIPPKEKDKTKIKQLYKLLEAWIEFGRIKLPQGYHPNDVEKEWGKLIIAMLEREKSLRPEVERLEMLQQIACRLQCDSVTCEDKLLLARNSLQLDAKRLESGLQFQNETEVAGYLLESENLIRQQIVDVQILIDGKYYQADQLVQRVAKLRDELMLLKSDCSSVYSKGRSLSTEQTQLMMAGLTQSLNQSFSSGFSQSLAPSFTSSLSRSLTPGLTPVLTPSLPVTLSSGLKPVLAHGFIQGFVPSLDTDTIQTVKLMQIRKPLMRSQFVDQTLTEEEINMNFLQDLLSWVEDMQMQLDRAEWGSDLPSIDSHLENHKNVHRAIEDFESSIREARAAEGQMTPPLCESYSEKLSMLESQYIKLLATSRDRASHLDNLQSFVSRATNELIWLNEKEEEEVAYDWSDRNSSMLRKKEYHAELMRELEDKDLLMRSVQEMADQLLLSRHPARSTIEAFKAAMQTQWSWILQLCYCVEKHLKENTSYFEFYNDAKESMDYLKNLQETIKRKYNCDKSSSLLRLEDLVQDSMDEKEQLLQYRSNVAGLMSRAKTIVQLKPRNPENPIRISIPIKAICDYKQIEITIYKEDECVLENNSHRAKWKVISPTGNEAMVPSVCFSVPPPNKEAVEMASRIEQLYQNVLALWHQSHINMKSVVSWHYLMNEISTIRAWNVSSIKTMLPGEHQQVLSSLQEHLKDFLEDSQESEAFLVTDGNQLEREVKFCKQYYEDLLKSAEREEQEESACNLFISEVRNIRLRVENCEKRLIRQIRTPLERDDLQESVQRISEQEKLKSELEELIVDLEKVTEKCDKFFGQASSSSAPTLRTELNVVLQNLNQVYSLSSIYLDKLKTVNLIVKNTQEAEALVKQYETKLGEEDAVPPDTEAIQSLQNTLKQWRTEVDERREVFHSLEDELQKGKAVSERMLRSHNERDMDMDWHKEKAVQLAERWESIHSQIDNRLHELESISISLNWYRDCHKDLDQWIQEMETTQQKMQERQPEDIRALADELNQQKMLASEVEMKQGRMDECQKYSDEYSSAVKEYELQLMTYKAMVDSQQKSPVKRRRMQSSSDIIVQEFMDLRTRYTALVTLMTQYVKFASDALKRSEEEESSTEDVKESLVKDAAEPARAGSRAEAALGEGAGLAAACSRTCLEMGAESLQIQRVGSEAQCLTNEGTEKDDKTTRPMMALESWFLHERRSKDIPDGHDWESASKPEPERGGLPLRNQCFANKVVHHDGERFESDKEEKSRCEEERRDKPFVSSGAARFLDGTFLAQGEACQVEEFGDQLQSNMEACHGSAVGSKVAGQEMDASQPNVQGSYRTELGQLSTENLGNPEDITNGYSGLVKDEDLFQQSANLAGEQRHEAKGNTSAREVTLPQTKSKNREEPTVQMQQSEIKWQIVDCTGNDADEYLLDFHSIIKPGKMLEEGCTSFTRAAVDGRSEVREEGAAHLRVLADELKRHKPAVEEKANSVPSGTPHSRKGQQSDKLEMELDGAAQHNERQLGYMEEGLQHAGELSVNKKPTVEEKCLLTNPTELEFYSPPANKSMSWGKSDQLEFEQNSEQWEEQRAEMRKQSNTRGEMVKGLARQISLEGVTRMSEDEEFISLTPDAQNKYDVLKGTDQTDSFSKLADTEPSQRHRLSEADYVDQPIPFDEHVDGKRIHIHEVHAEELGDQCDGIVQFGSMRKKIPEQVKSTEESNSTVKPQEVCFTEVEPDVSTAVNCCRFEIARTLFEPDGNNEEELEESAENSMKIQKPKSSESGRAKSSNSILQATIEMVPDGQSVCSESNQWAVEKADFHVELTVEDQIRLQKEHSIKTKPSIQDCTLNNQERSLTSQRNDLNRNFQVKKEKLQDELAGSITCGLAEISKVKMTPSAAIGENGMTVQPGSNDSESAIVVDSDRPAKSHQLETKQMGHLLQLSASGDPVHVIRNQQSPGMQGVPDGVHQGESTIGFQAKYPRNLGAQIRESSTEVGMCWEEDGSAQEGVFCVLELLKLQKMEERCEVEHWLRPHFSAYVKTASCPRQAEEKSVEEAKQEHVDKVGELLKWVSDKSKSLAKRQLKSPAAEPGGVDTSLSEKQVLRVELLNKKDQIAEAIHMTQMFLAKHSDKISEEDKQQTEKQLESLQEAYDNLCEQSSDGLQQTQSTLVEEAVEKAFEERQGECNKRLQEMCDLLMVTENKIIGYDSGMSITGDGLADLQQHQVEHQDLQREIQANASTLANVVSATEQFLEKNRDKLQPEERAAMVKKLKEAKLKLNVLSEQVDSNLKNLDNAVTTALKQETEKAAAVEQLKENESKIRGLLGWLSSIGQEPAIEPKGKEMVQQNGNTISVDGLKRLENEDTVNGNLPCDQSETKADDVMELTTDGELNRQYQKAKLHHQQVVSQQQSYIISTQSVQDFLQKQGSSIPTEERAKLEKDLNELKVQYETALGQSETRLKLIQTVQDELQKFSTDYSEFENWLHQSEQQLEDLQSGATEVEVFIGKLQRQKSFSEDVISHKGDLRYITISGQRVLDAANSCAKLDLGKDAKPCIDTSATCALVQSQLEMASGCYKSLHSKCNILGKNLKDVVDKYSQYQEISSGLVPWLQATEEAAKTQLTEAIAADPKNLQKQLEQVKALQDQMSGHQSVVEKLRKTVDALIGTDGNLLLNRDEIQDNLDDVVLRYENLSKSASDRNEKLRMTLTRSLSVQDGLDEMLDWMANVEKSLEDEEEMPLNSAALQEAFSKNAALEQNIASRQSSITAIKEKANKFIATADPSTASALQTKVDELAKRFASASGQNKERTARLEKLGAKVELFEKTYQKIEQFVTKKSQSLPEIDGPGKDVSELSQHMQEMNADLLDQRKDLNTLNQLAEELGGCATAKERTQILNKVNTLSKNFQELEEATKKKEEELLCCQSQTDQFKSLLRSFRKWVEGMNTRIPIIEPSLTTETLQGYLSNVQVMLDEWSSKASELEEVNRKGSALCHLINTLTSPAHSRAIFRSGTQVVNGGGAVSAVCDSKELIAVQQDVTDVNHQYEEVGGMLKDKESQLESMLAQRQQIQEESHLVKEWLESMEKRAASWDTLPTETEAIKEQVEQHKMFEAELSQNTGKVEQVKEKLALLLEENTNAPEAGKWRQTLDYINSKWQQVSQSVVERQQKLEESSSFLIQFETAEVQLSQWLVEKELMMNVLGPLSIDPHMLNNQKQQVQILLKEFETRKPQHEQLKTAAEGILSRSDDPAPACGVVSDQLAAVTQKWDSLTGQLVDRSDLIDQAIVKSTRYQNLVRDLSGKLSALDVKLASQPPIDAQPEAVKCQLEVASEIRSELKREENCVQEARVLCEEISALVGEQYLKAELGRQLDNVLKPFRDLEERAGNRVHQLQSALANSKQFQQMFDEFQAWMGGKCSEQSQRAPISAKLERLHLLTDEQAEFRKSLAQKAGSYEMILAEGEALLQNMQPGAEKTALQGRLGTLRADWEELAKQVEARHEKLRDCLQKAQKYSECVEHLLPWIQECEAKASRVHVCSDAAEIDSSLENIKALQNDVDKHRRALESLNNAADCLVEASQADLVDIQREKASVNQKVDLINEQLRLKIDSLDEMAKCMKEFQNSLKDAKKQLDGAKQQLELHDALGPQAYSNKCLTNMNAQQKALQALTPQVENVKRLAQRLAAGTSDGAGTTLLLRQADTLQEDYGSVSQQVRERCSFLETKLQGIEQFQNNIREMFSLFADLDDELDSMAPVGRDLGCLHVQKDGIQEFIIKLQELTTSIEGAKKEGKKMLESASSPDLLGLKRDLDALSKQCNKLLDRATIRREQVETTLARVEEFNSRCKVFSELVAVAEEHEESQGSVGMETDVINQQLESFKVFQKEEIEPLQTLLQEVNRLGQGLIQSAAKNTNIQKLEHDLEETNTRWNTLTTKVAERAAKLQEALLHCGRFQDALESLLSWLMDTEELVANQKPPSAEFKVVKAQIQEQKLLQHLLDDRKPTVEMIKREGEKIAGLADSTDREKTLNQLQGLSCRWNSLLTKAENRQRQLEAILVVAQQFHDTVEPLMEWLSAAEKKVANSEPIGTQTARLQEQIAQHKATEDDVVSHGKQLHQAISIGQLLKTMSSRDDKDMVQGRLDSAQTRYIEIQDRCGRKAALIKQALSNAWIFGEEEVEVLNWLAEVQDKLDNVPVQDYNPDLLQKQHSEHLTLHEEIMLRKQHVDQAVKNGLALLKQTTGDEVIIIQERLDGIKARYAEITTTSGKVLKTLEQALQLATKFQSAHEVLATWLEKVEAELTTYASEILAGEQLAHAQERQKELRKEMMEHRVSLDTVNEVSSALLELVPWRAREGLDKLVSDDNERYRIVSDTIAQKVEEIDAAIQRSQQFEQAADAEIAWIMETEKKLKSLGDIRLEQDQTSAELQVQKAFSMDILRHKDTIDELVANGDQIMNSCTEDEKASLKSKLDTLQKQYEVISQMNAERYLQLERAQSLVSQFCETYEELWPWLEETRVLITQLPTPAIEFEMLKQQQEELRQLRELIAEHKPHIDKMNKTGPQLLELSPREGLAIQQKYTAADALYSKVKEDVKRRAASLDEAISQSTQFHDKISPMLEALERITVRLQQPPSISAEVEKIREQISENKNVTMELEKLQPAFETLKQRGDDLIGRSEGADKDFCAKAVQDQLDKMVFYWVDIRARVEEQEAKLLDVMDLAEKFWCDHSALIVTIKDTQDLIRELEEPGIDPSVVKEQQEALETIKEEVDGLQEELEIVQNLGAELTSACGEPDKPVVKKNIDELNCTWDNLNKGWKDRIDRLDEAMQEAVQFQDALQAMFDWMDIAESKLNTMSPIGTDLETVKQQIAELKQFKTEAYQQQIEMERLNHQGELLLKKVIKDDAKRVVQEPLHELKHLWENLDGKIVNRQHKLEGALLALGQFQHALDELMTWLTHTEELLNEQKAVGGDPKAIEIAIAKHHVLQNDVLAHKSTVETVNKAGNDLLESSAGEEASSLQSKLESLNQRWTNVLEQTAQRQQQLHHSLIQAQGFQSEIENMQQWLVETERHLSASKPVGGLPETAREQLNVHLELCAAFGSKEEIYKNLINKGRLSCEGADDSNVEQGINNLKERWESVEVKLNEQKVKLEEALNLATEFHNSLQDFINWLTQAEQTLTLASPPSLILDTIMFQIDEHKVFANEVNSHREKIIELDKTGTHLKYFSQKQDVVLIKNLLISVQARWEKVVQRSVDRGRGLDDARKRAKQFQEAWKKLMEWLEDSEKNLDSDLEIANDPDKVKMQLVNHKEFQKALGAKHSVYDTTVRTGRSLKEKTTLADDHQKLDDMLSELRDKWDTVCGKSVERQNKLEEALLFSGQFTDALQALIDWLYKIEPMLAEDQPVHGDIDLVMNLIDAHKGFQKELGKRTSGVQALKRSARELVEASRDDSSWVKVQMQELSTRWETVCALSVSKQARLEQALNQAEEFHSTVHVLLEWLAEAEQTLRFHGVLPDDDEALRALIEQHKEFVRKLEEKMIELNLAVGMGEAILSICHPDSITTIKHWITIIRARFEEVTAWAKQHQLRLEAALADVIANQELLENLLGWLQWSETILTQRDQEPLPQEIEEVKTLIAEHQTFMEEMTRKQPDVDKVTKTYKRKVAEPTQIASHIPIIEKGRSRKRFPARALYSPATQTIETKNPRANLLVSKWQQVWLLALDRRRKLNDALDRLEELREFANFDFDVWRKRYMRWMNHKKSRVMDFFRRIDKDQDGKITRQEFIDGILSSKFPTSRLEMSAVADIFDRDGDGYIDYYEFVAALHPNKDAYKPLTDADKIEDEVTRQVAKCKCAKRFQVEQIGENKYRFFLGNQFGDSQQLRLVRILRSTVMVRVGGGWMALDEFLVKNDPCRAKGRTNVELREKFMLPEAPSQSMAAFRSRGRRSRPSSRAASPNRSTSSASVSVPPASTNTPPKVTPIQGSKLRPPGYLSGKSFHSGDESNLTSTPPSRGRSQVPARESRKAPSRPTSRAGSKTGSRASSRRGSDASDFDISDIQSVCSDVSETVPDTSRSGSRAGSRPSSAKPSKIPTPSRRSPAASKLSAASKR